ncbi:MAG: DUF2283 domain-containing protein [Candidatus Korobacteraceae bacterium]|jgi:hypothetical protein
MKLHHYPDTDSLYIDLNANPSADSREVAEGLVIATWIPLAMWWALTSNTRRKYWI